MVSVAFGNYVSRDTEFWIFFFLQTVSLLHDQDPTRKSSFKMVFIAAICGALKREENVCHRDQSFT